MSDNDSDEPIGRRKQTSRKSSASSRKKGAQKEISRAKAKRKIVSSDDEKIEDVKPQKPPVVIESVDKRKSIESTLSSPLITAAIDTPSFSPLLKGPPSPRHRSESLNWRHKVNLIGEKVVDPMIHICDKCHLPILTYARMIPCKHVFCLECGRAAEKICHKCGDKVTRIEQTTLGRVFMCTHTQGKNREHCKRTYLSQRDLQAHISHRHVKAKEKQVVATTAATGPPTQTAPVVSQPASKDPWLTHSLPPVAPTQRASAVQVPVVAAKIPFTPGPPVLPPMTGVAPLSSVPPTGPTSYLTPPPAYPPQMVPPPSAVYASSNPYPGVPSANPYAHAPPPNAYAPPAQFVPQPPPNAYEDYRNANVPPPNHWQRPPRDYRQNGYYRP